MRAGVLTKRGSEEIAALEVKEIITTGRTEMDKLKKEKKK